MSLRRTIGYCAALSLGILPNIAHAQSVNVTRSILPDLPYTLIYPEDMALAGSVDTSLVLTAPQAPLQCQLTIVPTDDTGWTAESALSALDDAETASSWSTSFPGFVLTAKGTTPYQSTNALTYEGTAAESPLGMPLTIVHTEAVDEGRGYLFDCMYGVEFEAQLRPVVDFIFANFSTRADADCCIGAVVDDSDNAPLPAVQ